MTLVWLLNMALAAVPQVEGPMEPAAGEPAPVEPGPSASRLCADAASGTEIEVCLRLGVTHPEQVDGIADALRSHIDRASSDDRELLAALLLLLSEQKGFDGARLLGQLGDPRALPVLVHTVGTRSPPIAVAAVGAMAAYPDALQPLAAWLVDRDERLEVRLAAADALGRLRRAQAADALVDLLRRPRIPLALRQEASLAVRRWYPERVADLEGQVSTDGTLWLTAGTAWGLGYAMATAGRFGQSDLTALGAVTGASAGATSGYLFGKAWPMEAGDAALITTSGFAGTIGGMFLGAATESEDATWLVGLGGSVVGYGVGYGVHRLHKGTGADAAEAIGVSVGAGTVLAGTTLFAGGDSDAVLAATGIGVVAGTVVGHAAAPNIVADGADAALVTLASSYGLITGLLLPIGLQDRQGLPPATWATGGLVAYGLAGVLDPPADVLVGGTAGAVFGGVGGAGIGLLVDSSAFEPAGGGAVIGMTAGAVGGALAIAQDPSPVDDRDVVLVGLTTSWTLWQTLGWGAALDADDDLVGLTLLLPSAVGAGTALVSSEVDVSSAHSLAAVSLGVWGGYFGGVAGELAVRDPLPMALVGSDVGLVSGAVMMAPVLGAPPLVVGLADAGGVLGGSMGALGASFATEDSDAILISSLVGAGVGLGTGAGVGLHWYRSGTRDHARLRLPRVRRSTARIALAPATLQGQHGSVPGGQLQVIGW